MRLRMSKEYEDAYRRHRLAQRVHGKHLERDDYAPSPATFKVGDWEAERIRARVDAEISREPQTTVCRR
jgi:hypothetical protein